MEVLVIEDSRWNQESAQETLGDHDVTLAKDIDEAYRALQSSEEFDAVLTDLHLPRGGWTGSVARRRVERTNSLPAGLVFALKASNMGIPTVIFTDANHHDDWFCGLLDLVGDQSVFGDGEEPANESARVAYVEARSASLGRWDAEAEEVVDPFETDVPNDAPQVKNWATAMSRSGLFPELEISDR
jgi:CheY-like chemotaxis protein